MRRGGEVGTDLILATLPKTRDNEYLHESTDSALLANSLDSAVGSGSTVAFTQWLVVVG